VGKKVPGFGNPVQKLFSTWSSSPELVHLMHVLHELYCSLTAQKAFEWLIPAEVGRLSRAGQPRWNRHDGDVQLLGGLLDFWGTVSCELVQQWLSIKSEVVIKPLRNL